MKQLRRQSTWILITLVALAGTLQAQVEPDRPADLAAKSFRHADLEGEDVFVAPGELPLKAAGAAVSRLDALGVSKSSARLDARSGRFVTLLPTAALIPGDGVGNDLRWSDLGIVRPKSGVDLKQAAWQAFLAYLEANQAALDVDPSELTDAPVLTSYDGGDMIHIHAPRLIDGIAVRGNYISGTVKKGNLILLGIHKWSDRGTGSSRPWISEDEARTAAEGHLSPWAVTREWGKPEKVYLALANGNAPAHSQGYRYQAAWAVKVNVAGDAGSWEVLVDAHTGEVLAAEDTNSYAEVKGGVLPVTNDGVVPDGVEQAGWPMPFQDVSTSSGTLTTDTGGNLSASGSMTATFFGPYVNINDNCGSDSLTQSGGIDWGTSAGTDCATPGFGGAGNTHASRTGFYELNKVIEMARGQLPGNSWLQSRLTSNMNINNTCNAFWNGTVNFYRSGGGCANTGEIAGVFDHEWGHGMDANDATPGIASPSGEGIADIYTALRLNTSCIGRNFRLGSNCTGNGDPCLACDGVRDIDYLKRQSGQPHDYSWSNANCGGSVHCVGGVYSEAVWSLWKRKLTSPPYNYDNNTAHEITTRLTFIGAGNTGTWFSGGPPNGGCGGSSGYMNYLAADDDNGNLNDGTPHMTAIWESFNDQEIACNTPAVQDSGCAGTPSTAPSVNASTGNQQVSLSWGAVAGASEYEVFRTEGVFQCDFGKVKLGATTGTSWNDAGLQNGREYSYVVIPKGPADSCFGPASACVNATPAAAPDFTVSCAPGSHSIQQGANAVSTCTVSSLGGFSSSVSLSCSGQPAGISCGFSPGAVTPPSGGSANSTLTLSVDLSQATGTFNFDVQGVSGALTRTSAMSVTVTPEGQNGPQTAVFDATYQAPACLTPGSECDSTTLVDGRANLGPEPNQPNTINDSCADGTSGTYHNDESNDRIVVKTLDGLDFTEGATVQIDATVWAWSGFTSDTADFFFAADANNPSWTLITSIVPSGSGVQTLSTQYVLPAGGLQAVRVQFRYQSTNAPCAAGAYNDRDDLVFAVNAAGPQCTVDADCDDGLFCNGAETCNAGSCQAGTAPDCDDGVACTVDSCNEGTDSCDNTPNDGLCSNGLFCDGAETCSATLGCQSGTAPNCDDGVACTVDSCNEGTDSCDNTPDDGACDNGLFCDGAETCSATLGCQDGPDPCTGGQTCNETTDVCEGGGGGCPAGSIDFNTLALTSYSNQNVSNGTAVEDGGDTLHLTGNTWVRSTQTFSVTANTTIEFEFAGATQGEIHAIGFDENDTLNDAPRHFQFWGTQNWTGTGKIDWTPKYSGGGAFQSYSIPVGQSYTGNMWLVFTNDDDASAAADARFRCVRIVQPPPPSCTVNNDFETSTTGWVNGAASTCTTGAYVVGNPTNPSGGWQIVGSHSGVRSIFTATNSSAGVNDVDGGNCILRSPSWPVANTSTLSVWYWHGQRDNGDDPSGDFFRLQYSTNNGASWITMASRGDVTTSPVWTQATAAIPAGSTVQVRVQCSDGAGPGDLIECGIDDVSICDP